MKPLNFNRIIALIALCEFYIFIIGIMGISFILSIVLFLRGEIPWMLALLGIIAPMGVYYTIFAEVNMRLKDEFCEGKELYNVNTE